MLAQVIRRRSIEDLEWILLVLLGALVPTWLRGHGIILGVDSYFVLRPELAIHDALSAWSSVTNAGVPNFAIQTLPFYSLLFALTHAFGFKAAQLLILWSLIVLAALGMRMVLRAAFEWPQSWRTSVAITSIAALYAFNPFTTSFVWRYQTWMELTWASFPWLASLLILALRGRISVRRAATLGSLALLLGGSAYPHVLIPPVALVLAAIFCVLVINADDRRKAVRSGAVILSWWAVSLAWWIVPSLLFLHDFMTAWSAQYRADPYRLLNYGSQYTSIPNVIRLIGLFQLRLTPEGQPLYPWFGAFSGALGVVLYAFPVLTLAGFVVALRSRAHSAFARALSAVLGCVWIASVFLMKGAHAPLAGFNYALLSLPFGAAWQHPYDKFALPAVFSACVLAAMCLRAAIAWKSKAFDIALPIALAVVVLTEGWPAYSGQMLLSGTSLPGSVVSIPDYYDNAGALLTNVNGFTLQLPMRDNGETAFAWERGAQTNNDPLLENFNGGRPVIRMRSGFPYADSLIDSANVALRDQKHRAMVLSALGFGSIVLHRDWNSQYFPVNPDVSAYERLLKASDTGTAGGVVFSTSGSARGLKLPVDRVNENNFAVGFTASLNSVKREQTLFSSDSGLEVRWVLPGYFALYAPAQNGSVWIPGNSTPLARLQKCHIEVSIRNNVATLLVDGAVAGNAVISDRGVAKSVFLGSENRFRKFDGAISDFWLENENTVSAFSLEDRALRGRAPAFGWRVSGEENVSAKLPAHAFTVTTGSGAAGLKIPDAQLGTRSADVSMFIRLNDVKREQVLFSTDTGMALRWISPGYFELISPEGSRIFSPPLRLRSGAFFKVELTLSDGTAQIAVDDVPVAGGTFRTGNARTAFLGSANRFRPFSGTVAGLDIATDQHTYTLDDTPVTQALLKHFGWRVDRSTPHSGNMVERTFGKLDVFLTPCPSAYVYTADGFRGDVQGVLTNRASCGIRAAHVAENLPAKHCTGVKIVKFSAADVSGEDVHTTGSGSCLLIVNTSFAKGWTLTPLDAHGAVRAHGVVNGFANGFLVETTGPETFALRFQRQSIVWESAAAGLLIFLINLALLFTKTSAVRRVKSTLFPSGSNAY